MNAQDPLALKIAHLERDLREARFEQEKRAWLHRKCRGCGEEDETAGGDKGSLVELELRVAKGEEGDAEITGWICSECLFRLTEALDNLALTLHDHGGVNYLEAYNCPGQQRPDMCPTPEEPRE